MVFVGFITRTARKVPTNYTDTIYLLLYSIYRNNNNTWNKKVYLLIAKTLYPLISCNFFVYMPTMFFRSSTVLVIRGHFVL